MRGFGAVAAGVEAVKVWGGMALTDTLFRRFGCRVTPLRAGLGVIIKGRVGFEGVFTATLP